MIENYYNISNDEQGLNSAFRAGLGELLHLFPNYWGINLCSIRGVYTKQQDDKQYVQIRIDFIPGKDPEEN